MDGIMIVCPYCDTDNIEGIDTCEQCGHSLRDLHLPSPATEVERSLLKDSIGVLDPVAVVSVPPEMAVGEAIQLMVDNKIGSVFIVEDDKLLGVFTERDALLRLDPNADDVRSQPVSRVMTSKPQTLEAKNRVVFAVRLMDQGGYRHVPLVTAEGKPEGVISARDILGYLAEKMAVSRGK